MFALLLTWLMAAQQPAAVLGSITPPAGMTLSNPIRVTLLPSKYAQLWDSEAQQRLDTYWETYKPAFAQKKELFFEISVLARREALDFVVARMRGNNQINLTSLVVQSTAKGQFEFRQVPPGEYKIVATGAVNGRELVWSEALQVGTLSPVIVQLKPAEP